MLSEKKHKQQSTYSLTVSESPITINERLGRVMATKARISLLSSDRGTRGLTIEPALLSEESHFPVRITPDKAHDDGLFLSPLESVYATEFDTREGFL